MSVENDCEDQGFSTIEEGCHRCQLNEIVLNSAGLEVLRNAPIEARDGFWRCTVCDGNLPFFRTGAKPAPRRSATAPPRMNPRLSTPTTISIFRPSNGFTMAPIVE